MKTDCHQLTETNVGSEDLPEIFLEKIRTVLHMMENDKFPEEEYFFAGNRMDIVFIKNILTVAT